MTVGKIRKAIAAFGTATVGMLAIFGLSPEFATAENITAAAGVVAAIVGAVWGIPNEQA